MNTNTTLPPKKQNRAKLTFEKIQFCAERIILDEGLDALTMRRLAEVASVGIGTIYGHYSNRDELIQVIYKERLAEKLRLIDETLLAKDTNASSALIDLFTRSADTEDMGELDLALFRARQHTPSVKDIVSTFETGLFDRYLTFLRYHARNAPEIEVEVAARFQMVFEHSLLLTESMLPPAQRPFLQRHYVRTLAQLMRDLGIDVNADFEATAVKTFGP